MNQDLGLNGIASYAFGALALLGALYACFGRSILSVSIALLVTLAAIAGLLLACGLEYLALIMAFVAVLAPILLITFASSMVGDLGKGSLEERASPRNQVSRIAGFVTGLLSGGLLAALLVSVPFLGDLPADAVNPGSLRVGHLLLGEHVVVFQVLALACLGVVMGVGTLLRRRGDR